MSYTKPILCLIAALMVVPATCSASIVIDDFGTSPDVSLVEDGSVSRRFSGGTSQVSGGFEFAPDRLSSLVYESSVGNFGSISSDFQNGVSFSSSSVTTGSDFQLALYADGAFVGLQDIVNGGLTFNVDLSAASQLMFLTLGCSDGGHSASIGGSFSAVPEPTSLILVGIACSGMLFRRKRSLVASEV